MLHGYKKSRYNIYDNLEFLGLNPYEQKHFCFGEDGGEGNGEGGAAVDPNDPTSLSTDTPGLSAKEAAAAAAQADAAMSAAGLNAVDNPEAAQAALDAAAANVAGYDLGDYSDAVSPSRASAAELDALEAAGLIGYTGKVNLGYVDAVDRENRAFDLALARDIAAKYGLDPSQVQPGFMQDPAYGPQTMSYRGPGALGAAATEVGKAAAELGVTLAEMYPSPAKMALTIAQKEFGLDVPSLGLKEGISGYFDELTASQRETNRADRGELSETEAAKDDPFGETEAAQNALGVPEAGVTGPDLGISSIDIANIAAQAEPASFGDIDLDGNEFIPLSPAIPSVPSVAPQQAAEVVRPPVTRTAATDTFSILAGIYGPDVAEKLLPTRTV
jgi:hypothetical protein